MQIIEFNQAGKVVKEARESKGWGIRECAQKLGMSPIHLNDLERGNRLFTQAEFAKISELLGIESVEFDLYVADNHVHIPVRNRFHIDWSPDVSEEEKEQFLGFLEGLNQES